VARGRMPTAHDASRQVMVSVIPNGRPFRHFSQRRAQTVPIGLDDPEYDLVQDPAYDRVRRIRFVRPLLLGYDLPSYLPVRKWRNMYSCRAVWFPRWGRG
jgi:hypothetical protein